MVPGILDLPAWLGLPFTIDEADISLTDYGLALETAIFAVLVARQSTRWQRLRRWSVALFGSAAIASIAGGTDHGFFRRDGRELGHDVLWVTSLLAIGASALALVAIAAEIGFTRTTAGRVTAVATLLAASYAVVVLVAWREFLVAILAYAPAAFFLLGILVRRYVEFRDRASLLGIAAVTLAFAAAAVQQLELGVDDRYLGHNALYHLIQGVSFALLFAAVRDELGRPAREPGPSTMVSTGGSA